MWTLEILSICIVSLSYTGTLGEKCGNRTRSTYSANVQEQLLFSPGYPRNYEVDDDCTWLISDTSVVSGYVIQLATVEMDLIDYNRNCSTDYVAIYEGAGTHGRLLAKWCGREKQYLRAARQVTVRFHSDDKFTGRGFVISYSLVRSAKFQCVQGDPNTLYVGQAAVYQRFQGKSWVPSCEWNIQSNDNTTKLVIELVKPSNVSCTDGSYQFFDGGDTSSHVSYRYCSMEKPFSRMYLRSNKAVIIFRNLAGTEPDGLHLKFSAQPHLYDCTVSDMPTVEVRDGPVMLALPLAYNSRDTPCPVRLWNPDTTTHLRLDVMGTDKQEADCDTDVIQVSEMSSGNYLERSCNRGNNPVYRRSDSDSLIVTSTTDVYIRAATVDPDCDGRIVRITADNSQIKEQMIPRVGKFSNLDTCKYLLSGENPEDTVHLTLTWEAIVSRNQSTQDTVCEGDYVNIYDGNRETSPVLFSSCWPRDQTDGTFSTTVVSSQRRLLVVLDADAKIEGKSANIEFHSIPGGHHCTNITEVYVNRNGTRLTAPNYPGLFPMNQVCLYRIIAENPEDSLVINVEAANLDKHCKSYLAVFRGRYQIMSGGFPVGRICDDDRPTLQIHSAVATMVAVSGDVAQPYAWRVFIKAEEAGHSTGNTITFSLTVLILIPATQLFIYNA